MWDVADGDVPGYTTTEFVPDFHQLLVLQRGRGAVLVVWIEQSPCMTAEFELAGKPGRADPVRQGVVSGFMNRGC